MESSSLINQGKMIAGRKAVDFIQSGMTVGMGTGSTAYYFIDELGRRIRNGQLENITAVSTSRRSTEQAESLGIRVVSIDMVDRIDCLVDGADETTTDFCGIKGGGGALLYEKIVAMASDRSVWIVTPEKVVNTLGAYPLPVEVVQFGSLRLYSKFKEMGFNPTFRRMEDDRLFITEAGNYIFDLHLDRIEAPHQLAHELDQTVGVVEHGLFLNIATSIIVGADDGAITIYGEEPPTH